MFTKEEILRKFPISRDPPEGGTVREVVMYLMEPIVSNF